MPELKTFRAAVVQAAPVFLDADRTVAKVCSLIKEAAGNGAQLVAFPEAFVPGYPYWNWVQTPLQGATWFESLYSASIDVPGRHVDALCAAAAEHECVVVVGVNERDRRSVGTLYNSTLVIDESGMLRSCHRKLVPTWAEKLTWAQGDGSTLNVIDTSIGPLGVLACGENTNTLARFALLAQGELVHVATYAALPVAGGYDMMEAIKLRAGAHSFEGKIFTLVACSVVGDDVVDALASHDKALAESFRRPCASFSGIFGPDGRLITAPLVDDEGIRYADIDLHACVGPTQMHDITGHYNRFDVLQLTLNKTPQTAVRVVNQQVDDGNTSSTVGDLNSASELGAPHPLRMVDNALSRGPVDVHVT